MKRRPVLAAALDDHRAGRRTADVDRGRSCAGRWRPDHDQRVRHERAGPGYDRLRSRSATRCSSPPVQSAKHPVPMIMHSHGWGGSRSTSASDFTAFLDAGYGVLSFDQRGFGESGGHGVRREPDRRGPRRPQARPAWSASSVGSSRTGRATPTSGRSAGATGVATSSSPPSRNSASHGQAGLRRPGAGDHLERPQPQPRAPGRPARESAGSRAQRRVGAVARPCRRASTRRSSRASRPGDGLDPSVPGTENLGEVLQEERTFLARRPRAQDQRPRAVRPGHDRLAVRPSAGHRQLADSDHGPGAQAEHVHRLQRRPRAALGVPPRRPRPPPTRARRRSAAATFFGPVAEVLRQGAQGQALHV